MAEIIAGEQESFARCFPHLDDIEVCARQILYSGRTAWGESVLTRQNFPGGWTLRCGDRFCNGMFNLRGLVHALVKEGVENGVRMEKCGGTRSSPEGRRVYGPCARSWRLSARLVHKEGKEDQPDW